MQCYGSAVEQALHGTDPFVDRQDQQCAFFILQESYNCNDTVTPCDQAGVSGCIYGIIADSWYLVMPCAVCASTYCLML